MVEMICSLLFFNSAACESIGLFLLLSLAYLKPSPSLTWQGNKVKQITNHSSFYSTHESFEETNKQMLAILIQGLCFEELWPCSWIKLVTQTCFQEKSSLFKNNKYYETRINPQGLLKAKLCRWYEKDCVRVSSLWWKREQRECCKLAVAIRTHSAGSGDRQNNGHVKIVTAGSLFTKCEANREAWRRPCRRHCCWEQMNVFHKLATVAVCYWKSRVRQNCCKGLAGFHDVLRKFQVDNNWQRHSEPQTQQTDQSHTGNSGLK